MTSMKYFEYSTFLNKWFVKYPKRTVAKNKFVYLSKLKYCSLLLHTRTKIDEIVIRMPVIKL